MNAHHAGLALTVALGVATGAACQSVESNRTGRAERLEAAAAARMDAREQAEAERLALEALRLREGTVGERDPALAAPLLRLARIVRKRKRDGPSHARPYFDRALRIVETEHRDEPLRVAAVRAEVGRFLIDSAGQWEEEGGALIRSALATRERVLGPDHALVADSLSDLAVLLVKRRAFAEAHAAIERARSVRAEAFGGRSAEHARSLDDLGVLASERGDPLEAERRFREVLRLREEVLPESHPELAASLGRLGLLLKGQARFAEAEPLLRRSVDLLERHTGESYETAVAHLYLGLLLQAQARLAEAQTEQERGLEILALESVHGEASVHLTYPLMNLAAILRAVGADDDADALYRRITKLWRDSYGDNLGALASVNVARSALLIDRGAHDEARVLLEPTIAFWRDHAAKHGTSKVPFLSHGLAQLAKIREAQGRPDEALALFDEAISVHRTDYGDTHPGSASLLVDRGSLLLRRSEPEGAGASFRAALELRRRAYGDGHPAVADAHAALAVATVDGDRAGAARAWSRALAIQARYLRRALPGLAARARLSLAARSRRHLNAFLAALPEDVDASYPWVLKFKGIVGRCEAAERRALRAAAGPEREAWEQLAAAQRRLAKLADAGAFEAEAYAEAAEEVERLAKASATAAVLRAIEDRLDLKLEDVVAALGEGEVLVDTIRHNAGYTAWVVVPSGEVTRVEIGSLTELEGKPGGDPASPEPAGAIERFRSALLGAGSEVDEALLRTGKRLRELLWEPLEPHLGNADVVYLVPDGALAAVPLGALPGDRKGTFLSDTRAVALLGSAQDLSAVERRPRGHGALVLAPVSFDTPGSDATSPPAAPLEGPIVAAAGGPLDSRSTSRSPTAGPSGLQPFAALPYTAAEAREVAGGYRDRDGEASRILLGASATEAALRALAPGRRVVHFATHGFVRHDLPSAFQAALAERADGIRAGQERHLSGWNPMLLSGLALAGANVRDGGGDDDGILTALEVGSLDLGQAEVVVLSACDTARGDTRAGEGVLGLVRGFRTAGAATVVASLWPVDDRATRRLMELFYARAFAEDGAQSPAVALREAALALRALEVEVPDPEATALSGRPMTGRVRAFAAPRHWAAFVAYGRLR